MIQQRKTIADSADSKRRSKEAISAQEELFKASLASLEQTARFVEKKGTECLESTHLTVEERAFVEEQCCCLKVVLADVTLILDATRSPMQRANICDAVARSLLSAFGLAMHAPPAPAIKRMEKFWQAATARAGRKNKQPMNQADLIPAIQAEAKILNTRLMASWKCANIIRPGVRKRLGVPESDIEMKGYPEVGTIKQAISLMQKKYSGTRSK